MKLYLLPLLFLPPAAAKDSCIECHKALDGNLQKPALSFASDIHRHAGFGCADCHGGDRNSDDMEVSMSRAKGFQGKLARTAVPRMCARCLARSKSCSLRRRMTVNLCSR